jgi:hypothetical protein
MKANGAELIDVKDRTFIFTSHIGERMWRLQHSNSCCKRVDDELLTLKRMMTAQS